MENGLEFADDTIDELEDKVSKLQKSLSYFREFMITSYKNCMKKKLLMIMT